MKTRIHALLHRTGFDVVRYDGRHFYERRRAEVLEKRNVDLVLDVGASVGHFAAGLRSTGYGGRIVSFEPAGAAYKRLAEQVDERWEAINAAVGSERSEVLLNLAENSWSSSLRPMKEKHLVAAPLSRFVGSETVRTVALDDFGYQGRIYLKIDTQGYEREVLGGAYETLRSCEVVDIELSLVPLYDGQALLPELIELLYASEFYLGGISTVMRADEEILQLDGLFLRR